MGFFLSQRPDESSPVILESFLLRHFLRGCVLRNSLEERLQKSVIVLAGMDSLEPYVFDSRKGQHHGKDWMSPTVETRIWS